MVMMLALAEAITFANCARCKAKYVLSPEDLGERGSRVRCQICGNEWFQAPSKLNTLKDNFYLAPYPEERRKQFEPQAPKAPRPNGVNIFVANLPFQASESDVDSLFGAVVSEPVVNIVRDPVGRSRGYGFVNVEDGDAAQKAIDALNGSDFKGRRIVVKHSNDSSLESSSRRRRPPPPPTGKSKESPLEGARR
ncbi:hypothetical protein CTAYLR_007556 [Chrysophaeum taylorii]|uniref:RRM domain-containing protein n=1 Tax=Chrysophaeum taylorii TaxID=2483200 RepID=A0AAD7U4X7_9STRA|nr:hypothetical protein CTAYLR_007556 [Chrysophaeum taylorii]